MARYIDAEALKDRMFNYYECVNANTGKGNYRGETLMNYEVADMIEDCIDNAPTADVVPKSEVDEIIGKFECFLCHATGGRLSKYTYDLRTMEIVETDCIIETYTDGYAEGGKDVAREIFEEIEDLFFNKYLLGNITASLFEDKYAILKKKYTGE